MTAAVVREAAAADKKRVSDMLARAFADDPAISFIFPDPVERARRAPKLFALLFDTDGPRGIRLMTGGGEAATLWRSPGQAHTGVWEMLRSAVPMLGALGPAIARALRVSNAIDAHHPQGQYWYLHIAGCDPVHQGKGLGGAAIRAGLDRVVGDGLPTYLETPLEKNVGLYQSMGFDLTGEWRVPGGGPKFWSMLRPSDIARSTASGPLA